MEQTKVCRICGEVKPLGEFHKNKAHKDGRDGRCKVCKNEINKEWRKQNKGYYKKWRDNNLEKAHGYEKKYRDNNKEKIAERQKRWEEENKEYRSEYHKNWKKNNRDKCNAHDANRRAMKHALPYSTSSELWLDVIMEYNCKCAITGKDKFDLEHMIPLSWGWGGSLKNNIYPMDSTLNMKKSNMNPYKFLKRLKGKQRTNFEKVLHNLAKENGLTPKEYRKFVFWCEKHKRTLEEVLEDNEKGLTQIELWKLSIQNEN